MIILAAGAPYISLVEVHGPEGQRFYINPSAITSLREPIGADRKHFPAGMRCIVVMSSGKFVPVHETCDEMRDLVTHHPAADTTKPG